MSDQESANQTGSDVPAGGSLSDLVREFFGFVSIRGKQEVGRRMSLKVLASVYRLAVQPSATGPVLQSVQCPSAVRSATAAHVAHPAPELVVAHVNPSTQTVPLIT